MVSVLLSALRHTGRPMLTPGTWTEFTMFRLVLSRSRHLRLPVVTELLVLEAADRLVPLVKGLPILLTVVRLLVVSPPPHLWVAPSRPLVRGHG